MRHDLHRPTRRALIGAAGRCMAVLALAAIPLRAARADPPAPGSTIKGAKNMTAPELNALMGGAGGVAGGERVVIIDARKPGLWEKGHLAKALKLDWRYSNITQSWQFDAKGLGGDKAAPLAIYGQNEADGWAGLAVQKAVSEGFSNVMWLRGGFAEWVAASLPTTS